MVSSERCALLVQCEERKFSMGALRGMPGLGALIIFFAANVFMRSLHGGKVTLMRIPVCVSMFRAFWPLAVSVALPAAARSLFPKHHPRIKPSVELKLNQYMPYI